MPHGVWQSEQAWFDVPLSLGSGGGVSALFDRPEWQRAVLPDRDQGRRLTPDVAAVADPFTGVKIVFNGKQLVGGGTSQSAPIWAGLAAVMNQYLVANGGRLLGDLNPLLYKVAEGARLPGFRDVTLGGNAVADAGARLRPGDRPRHTRRRQPRPQHPHPAEGDRVSDRPTRTPRPPWSARVCQTDVPAGEFCGLCGDHLTPRRGNGPSWLRIRAYGAAPGEHLLLPSLASSLFPHLPHRSRMPFRVVLVLVLVALVTFATLRMPAALITVAALGLPLLFLLYMRETDAYRDLPTRTLVLTAALGIGLGVGWVLLTGAMVARSYGVPLGAGIAGGPNSPGRARRPGRRHDPDAGARGGGAPDAAVDPRVVGRLHDRRAGSVGLHRGRHPDPAGAAIRDGDDRAQPPGQSRSSSRRASAGWRSR